MFEILTRLQILVLVMAGPLKDKDPETDHLNPWLLAEEVVSSYANTTEKTMELVKVLSYTNHGSFYILKLEMGQTGHEEYKSEICRFMMHGKEELSHVCGTPGGFKPVPSDDSQVQLAALYAVDDLNRRSNCIYQYKLVSVDHAMLKVEDGNDYLMNITTCMYRPQHTGVENAGQRIHPEIIQHCNVAVVVHPWEDQPKIMTDFKCTGCA